MRYRCPDNWYARGVPGPLYVVGCGHEFEATPDREGLIDCPNCGMWFPRRSSEALVPLDLTTRRRGEVARALRALRAHASRNPFGHRNVVAELRAGNPYLIAWMARRGLEYRDGAIQRKDSNP